MIRLTVCFPILAAAAFAWADPPPHPRTILDADDIAWFRGELKTVAWRRALYDGDDGRVPLLVHGASFTVRPKDWLGRPVVIPARGGHYHHFFCEDGRRLEFPPDDLPRAEGYRCPACGKRYAGEMYDAVVRWKIHKELSSAAFYLALAWAVEGDGRCARKAAEILTKYADAYPGPHTSVTEGGIFLQSLDESVWIIPLAWAYDLVWNAGVLTDAEKRNVEERLFRPVCRGLVAMGIAGNWGSWHLSAVGVVGYAIGDRELQEYALRSFQSQIRDQLGNDGLWPESVHTYHFFPLTAFLYLAETARHNGVDLYHWVPDPSPAESSVSVPVPVPLPVPGSTASGTGTGTGTGTSDPPAVPRPEAKGLHAMFSAPLRYMYPDFRLAAINDGWFASYLPLDLYELAWARYGDPGFSWALKTGYAARSAKRGGLWAMLAGRPFDVTVPAPSFPSVNYPFLGIAVLRSPGGNMMTFDYGPSLGHGQFDKMGITLFANGRLWAADYGTPGYGAASLAWYRSTAAHNTVVVDAADQRGTKERRLTRFGGTPSLEVAEAETEQAYPGVLHRRTLLRTGDDFLILDRLTAKEERTFDWCFRSEGTLDCAWRPEIAPPEASPYPFTRIDRSALTSGAWNAAWTQGKDRLRLFLLDDAPARVSFAECPAETTTRTVPFLIVRRSGRTATFTAALTADGGMTEDGIRMTDGLVRILRADATDWVSIADPAGKQVRLRTDGAYAWVRVQGDRPVRAAVIGGRFVEWDGRKILEAPEGRETWEAPVP